MDGKGFCKECGVYRISNAHYKLCHRCNQKRLLRRRDNRKRDKRISDDERVYEMIWNSKEHVCEECGCELGNEFRDFDGVVVDRFRYSHIMPKSTYPRLRHVWINFNLLCIDCHQCWENGEKEKMKIWEKNKVRINLMQTYLHQSR